MPVIGNTIHKTIDTETFYIYYQTVASVLVFKHFEYLLYIELAISIVHADKVHKNSFCIFFFFLVMIDMFLTF